MRTSDGSIKRFKLDTRYPHHRSEGLTNRTNKGTALQVRAGQYSRTVSAHAKRDQD